MSRGQARVGDTASGVCNMSGHNSSLPFTATFTSGSSYVNADGVPCVRVGDIAISSCGHPFVVTEGSNNVMQEGSQAHGVGNKIENANGDIGITNTGSSNAIIME